MDVFERVHRPRGHGRTLRLLAASLLATLFVVPGGSVNGAHAAITPATATTVATGLNNPRGLTVGPDGSLYAALAGSGPNANGTCAAGASSGGVVKITGSTVVPVTMNLPSSNAMGGRHYGAAAIAFIDNTMYVLEEGTCGTTAPKGIYRVGADGSVILVADLGKFYSSNPVKVPDLSDFGATGNPYSMTAMGGSLYVAEANHEEIDKVDPATGTITRLIDFSQEPWLGPTGIAAYNGSIYFGVLTEFPVVPGSAGIFKLNADGTATRVVSGLTAVTGLAIASDGTMYATEFSTAAGAPRAGSGAVVKISSSGLGTGASGITTVAGGLTFPTGVAIAPSGGVYVSNNSDFVGANTGQVLLVPSPATGQRSTQPASFVVTWTSAKAGAGMVLFGTGPGCTGLVDVAMSDMGAGTTSHTVVVTGNDLPGTVGDIGIQPGQTYWYETVVVGSAPDNNGGKCYSVTVPSP